MSNNFKIVSEIIYEIKILSNKHTELESINKNNFDKIVNEIDTLVRKFNSEDTFLNAINANYLKTILKDDLPGFDIILDCLRTEQDTKTKVIDEFNNSSYLKEVWQIEDLPALYVNILILIYRTTLLNKHAYLRQKQAQISSTLEELSAIFALEGNLTNIFIETKLWLRNWKEEGFSESFFKELNEKGLI